MLHSTGYEWVGWKNTTRGKDPVEIIFYFDSVKNFSSMSFYVNNFFSKDVQVQMYFKYVICLKS